MVELGGLWALIYSLLEAGALAALTVLVPFAINWFLKKTKVDELLGDDITRQYLTEVFDRAITYGKNKAGTWADGVDTSVDLGIENNPVLDFAVQYVLDTVPDALEHFNIATPEAVRERIIARLEKELGA